MHVRASLSAVECKSIESLNRQTYYQIDTSLAWCTLKTTSTTSRDHLTLSSHQNHPTSTNEYIKMRSIRQICYLAAIATTATAQSTYGAIVPTDSSSIVTTNSTLPTSYGSSSTLPPASSSAVPMTTRIYPANCTEACTTITEPCPNATVAPSAPYGTGSWTAPAAPPATGDYVAPPAPSTWVKPTAPSATPISEPSASPSVTPYEGAAAERLVGGGLVFALIGLLQIAI